MKTMISFLRVKFFLVLLILPVFLSCQDHKVGEINLGTIDSVRYEQFSGKKMKIIYFNKTGFVVDPMSPITDEEKRFDFYHVKYGDVLKTKNFLCEKNYVSTENKFQCHNVNSVK